MKRFWLLALLAGSLAVITAPVSAKMTEGDDAGSSQSDDLAQFQDDVNTGLGALTSRVAAIEKMMIEVHGFAELDSIFDTTQMGLGTETIGDNGGIPKPGSQAGDNGEAQFSPRNSRIDFLAQTSVDGWLTKGYLEGDFLGINNGPNGAAVTTGTTATGVGGSELKEYTQPTFRIRHAYLDAQKDGWDLMAGQYWTLYGWNMDYVLAPVDVSPIMGTLYERTPRIGVMKTFGGDLQAQIAVDAERPEQAISGIPNYNAGIRFILNDMKAQFAYATGASKLSALSIGISGTMREYAYGATAPNYAYKYLQGQGIAIDTLIPILPTTDLKDDANLVATGEWTAGSGVADALNGMSGGLGANPGSTGTLDPGIVGVRAGNLTLVDTQSWNAQLQFHLPKSAGTFFTLGYGEVFSDNLAFVGGTYNDVNGMFANVMEDFTPNVRVGLEYARFDEHFTGTYGNVTGPNDLDHRIQFSTWYRF